MSPFATLDDFLAHCALSWRALQAPKEESLARALFAPMAFPDSQLSLKCSRCGFGVGIESIDFSCRENCVNCGFSRECGSP